MLRALLFTMALLLTGCVGSGGHGVGSARKEVVKLGVIESVQPIEMDNSSNGGGMAGSIFGQVGGAGTGAGRGAVVGSVFGSVLGGTLGNQAGIASKQGLEIWVKLDGEEQSSYVMQPGKPDDFKIGDRVRIITKKGVNVVEPDIEPINPSNNLQ